MRLLLYTLVELLKKAATIRTSGASSGRCPSRVKLMASFSCFTSISLLMASAGVQVYGFLTVAEDANCGVCAHEIGHLGNFLHLVHRRASDNHDSVWLA
jgi:hypothetical protein